MSTAILPVPVLLPPAALPWLLGGASEGRALLRQLGVDEVEERVPPGPTWSAGVAPHGDGALAIETVDVIRRHLSTTVGRILVTGDGDGCVPTVLFVGEHVTLKLTFDVGHLRCQHVSTTAVRQQLAQELVPGGVWRLAAWRDGDALGRLVVDTYVRLEIVQGPGLPVRTNAPDDLGAGCRELIAIVTK